MKNILLTLMLDAFMTSGSLIVGNQTTQPVANQIIPPATPSSPEFTPTAIPIKEVPVVTAPIPTPTPKPTPVPVLVPTPKPSGYTLSDVQKHNTSSDCWMILSGGVYNVTSYIAQHPGGNQITQGCGKDATQMFSGHSASAKALKAQYKVGNLI